ncbi:hypothetical protein HNQ56_001209 [Anaerotaenia torta]|uniref:hypothetical protein n=1 Tax=Anaerotaenia torta TaxID=433293 RepID=UPI003D1AA54A
MKNKTLTNIYTGEHIGEIDGNIVRTPIDTYRVGDSDLQWLINEAVKRRNFSAMDVKAVGFLIYEDEDKKGKWFDTFGRNGQAIKMYVPTKDEDE